MSMDMSQYLDVFLEESKEHLNNLNEQLLELEKNSGDSAALNEIFRAAHTLKGMSSTMGFEDLADLTHHMENVLSDVKEGMLQVSSGVIDILFKCFDRLQMLIEQIEAGGSGAVDNSDLIVALENIKTSNCETAAVIEPTTAEMSDQRIMTSSAKEDFSFNEYDITVLKEAASRNLNIYYIKVMVDDSCLMKSVRAFMVFKALEEDGEIIKSNPSAQDLDEGKFDTTFELTYISKITQDVIISRLNTISEIQIPAIRALDVNMVSAASRTANTAPDHEVIDHDVNSHKKNHKTKQTVRVDIERLDNLMNLVGELVMHKGRLEQIGASSKLVELNETIEQIDRISTDLQSVVMKVRMVPIEQVFNRFPRMVRDLAKELNKEVDFLVEGKETELDRTVIDEIGDPLVHLIRNAIDHGLESPEERIKNGKPERGTLMLRARHEGNNVYIEVEDDGWGINIAKIKERAVAKGIVTAKEAEQLSRDETFDLLFNAGFSTSEKVTDISGRGVGLDVVKTKIESLSGEIFIDSTPGQGTRFKIKLPLTLAIIQALMIAVKDEIYAVPLSSVDETTMIRSDDIKMVQNQEVIMLRGNVLPLFRLAGLLKVPGITTQDEDMYVVVVRKAEKQIGLVVDRLIGQQEIVIKSLGKMLVGIPGIAGAIVAGDGNVRLILDITTLF
ncbi:MAG: chemotaxis protein CheA [Syntrophomonadaceae bacterium]|nr:chemotaxis protein CheA [Syntrophomonadaceae bacterium]MDD3888624.1 chemotaxis protein CheA [Syntrophomonadaceae bacterium]MDD4548247.1 chemotaxis protein CheA [Syntrophomonadaceae bacterium]